MAQEKQTRSPEPAKAWSPLELEILRVLAENSRSSLRRGQIHKALAPIVRPSPARVGQVLGKLLDCGLLEHQLAGARGNRNTAFYSLSAAGRQLAAEVSAFSIRLARPLPISEVGERVSVYDAAHRLLPSGISGPKEVLEDPGIEEIFGILKARRPVSLEAMDEAVRLRASARHSR